MIYNPLNWYWDNGTNVFSSASQTRVPYSDSAYQAWVASGNVATVDPGNVALRQLLAPYGIGLSPTETQVLQLFSQFDNAPWLINRVIFRLLFLLVKQGTITQAQATAILQTNEQTSPNS